MKTPEQEQPKKKRSGPRKPVGSRYRVICRYCRSQGYHSKAVGHPERRCKQKRHDLEKNKFKNR